MAEKNYERMSREELQAERERLQAEYEAFRARGLKLDLSRGKPSNRQLDMMTGMLDCLHTTADCKSVGGFDCRNYGVLNGTPEAKKLFSDLLGIPEKNLFIGGNSSLNLMYDAVARALLYGTCDGEPWVRYPGGVKFLCPVPGYDRHFGITGYFGIEMINIPMSPEGPDMDLVEKYVSEDESIKGIWCVPKYSNPQGYSYSDEVVRRFAALEPKAKDFRIYWDNAYTIHHLYDDDHDYILEILDECRRAGHPDMVYKFASTSKISFPGSGIAAIAASHNNLDDIKTQLAVQTIGHDKVNQLRHVRFFRDINGMNEHMKKHAAILRPKFETVLEILDRELSGLEIGTWTKPKGGYFISFDSLDGCAKDIVARCKKAGVVMTGAGATYPYGIDPHDSNIRIAPSYPPLSDLKVATELFALCVKIASIKKILADRAAGGAQ